MYNSKEQLVISKITSILNVLKQEYNNRQKKIYENIDIEQLRRKFQLAREIPVVLRKNSIIDGLGKEINILENVLSIEPIFIYKALKEHTKHINSTTIEERKLQKEKEKLLLIKKRQEVNKLLKAEIIEEKQVDSTPFPYVPIIENNYQLTKREQFAALAMQGYLHQESNIEDDMKFDEEQIARFAVEMADALIEELNKNK
jgi:hypothetical protein